MLYKTIFPIALSLFFLGCSIHGSLQGLYSYYEKTAAISPDLIQKATDPVCTLRQPEKPAVFVVNGKELRMCLEPFEDALVYIWTPKCHSDKCVPLDYLQAYTDKKDVELFIVAEYYDYKTMSTHYNIERPIFGIDCAYYGTQLVNKYVTGFMEDLMNGKGSGKEDYERFYLFKAGKMVGKAGDLNEVFE